MAFLQGAFVLHFLAGPVPSSSYYFVLMLRVLTLRATDVLPARRCSYRRTLLRVSLSYRVERCACERATRPTGVEGRNITTIIVTSVLVSR